MAVPGGERPRASPDDFIFGKHIGEGSFSYVFLAKDVRTQKEYAIKVCEKKFIVREKKTESIHREKDILKLLTAQWNNKVPFFVRLHSTFHDAQRLYFVLTYAKNGDLLKFIKRLADRDIDCTQFYAGELVAAVEYLHEKGIIHRDLKPENILLNERMHVLITDFGSAKLVRRTKRKRRRTGDNREENVESDEVTDSNDEEDVVDDDEAVPPKPKRKSFVGTPEYVSPEILTARGSSRASDLWAIGCILYQMITGIPPFKSRSEYMIFKKIERLDYSFHEGFDENAKDLVRRLLVIEPRDRLGARDKTFYTSLRSHAFFKGLDFDRLPESTPPAVAPFVQASDVPDPCWAKNPDAKPGPSRIPLLVVADDVTSSDEELLECCGCDTLADGVCSTHHKHNVAVAPRRSSKKSVILHITDEDRQHRLAQQAKSNEYHKFVKGRLILKQGILDKKKGLFAKRRMFLLTEGPHLVYVDPSAMVKKGEIPWSEEIRMEIRDFRIFFVHVPGRTYYLTDPDSTATDWCAALEEVKQFYYGTTQEEAKVTSTTKST